MSMASDSEVILQRLVSVTLNILINTSVADILLSYYYHSSIITLGSDLYSCYLPITLTSDKIHLDSLFIKSKKYLVNLFIMSIFDSLFDINIFLKLFELSLYAQNQYL